jgi:hypothetical protein
MQGISEAYLEPFICLAQRFFCASEICFRLIALTAENQPPTNATI